MDALRSITMNKTSKLNDQVAKTSHCTNFITQQTHYTIIPHYLHALLVHPEQRRTHRIVGIALQKALGKPLIEAGVVLLFQLGTILTDTVHRSAAT